MCESERDNRGGDIQGGCGLNEEGDWGTGRIMRRDKSPQSWSFSFASATNHHTLYVVFF